MTPEESARYWAAKKAQHQRALDFLAEARRGRVQNDVAVVPTITASNSENINVIETVYRIRKLTPRECWRLMGYTDANFEKAQAAGVSNTQLYKQAGNAIVKQVLMAIFSELL